MAKAEVFWDNEGEPWAVFVPGHVDDKHFLACARAIAKRNAIKVEGQIERLYMRDIEDDSDTPYRFCDGRTKNAKPVTCIKQPPLED